MVMGGEKRRPLGGRGIILLGLLLLMLLTSCGYRLKGQGRLPEGIARIAILPFANQSYETGLENDLYNDLVDEFARSRNLLLATPENADLLLRGTIKNVDSSAISYSPDDRTYEYRVAMVLDIVFERVADKSVFQRKTGLREVEEYKTSSEPLLVDRRRREALRRISRVMAENIHDGLFRNF